MAFEPSILLKVVVSLIWKCLSVPVTGKNAIFAQAFFDDDILFDIATAASLSFCPGLSEVINASFPPTVAFFKRLPQKILGLWGVYVLVLEKRSHESLVYIGSATNSDDSLVSRFKTYDKANRNPNEKGLPSKVKEALQKGYKIVYKGVLVSAPIPSAKNVPRYRLLFYAIEATFSFLFWTMYSKDKGKDYQMGSCCPWPRESFTYGGLCSHSALNDPMRANLNLSAEQLEQLVAQAKEDRKRYDREYKKRKRDALKEENPDKLKEKDKTGYHRRKNADPVGFAEAEHDRYERKKEEDPEYHNRMNRKNRARRKAEDPKGVSAGYADRYKRLKADPVAHQEKQQQESANHQRLKAERIASRKHWCAPCQRAFKNKSQHDFHTTSKAHVKRVKDVAAGVEFPYRCPHCQYSTNDPKGLSDHEKTPKHKRLAAAASA